MQVEYLLELICHSPDFCIGSLVCFIFCIAPFFSCFITRRSEVLHQASDALSA
jgi:hypothetical protein